MSAGFFLTLAALGFAGAFASGLVGVGGAIVMIPLLFYVPPLLAVGSLDIKLVAGVTMAQVLAASAMGVWTHGRGAMLHRRLALWGGSAMALGSLAGAVGSHFVEGRVLLLVFALMATTALLLMFIKPAEAGPWPLASVDALVTDASPRRLVLARTPEDAASAVAACRGPASRAFSPPARRMPP